jgi:hypothetical protein
VSAWLAACGASKYATLPYTGRHLHITSPPHTNSRALRPYVFSAPHFLTFRRRVNISRHAPSPREHEPVGSRFWPTRRLAWWAAPAAPLQDERYSTSFTPPPQVSLGSGLYYYMYLQSIAHIHTSPPSYDTYDTTIYMKPRPARRQNPQFCAFSGCVCLFHRKDSWGAR